MVGLRGGFPDLAYHSYKLRMVASPLFETASSSPHWPRAGRRGDGSSRGGWQHPDHHPDTGLLKLGAPVRPLGASMPYPHQASNLQRFRLAPPGRVPHAYPFEPPWDSRDR